MCVKKLFAAVIVAVALSFITISLSSAAEKKPVVRMAHIHVKPGMRDAFIAIVTEEMRASVQVEPGVLALYCVADKEHPDKLIFFEIYASEEDYQSHRTTPHFKRYIEKTKDMSVSKSLLETIPVELRDKWHQGN